jgi:CheY-like chemotaxis protein
MALEETAGKCSSCHHPAKLTNRIMNMQSLIRDYETNLSYAITTSANTERLRRLKKDGSEAIKLYQRALKSTMPFDAVIMDLTISGGMVGEEAIGKLIEMDSDVKAIVSSGYSTDTVMADFRKHGFSGVITKPYDIETLSVLLHDIILRKS